MFCGIMTVFDFFKIFYYPPVLLYRFRPMCHKVYEISPMISAITGDPKTVAAEGILKQFFISRLFCVIMFYAILLSKVWKI